MLSLRTAFAISLIMLVLDGWLTYVGVMRFGVKAELNPLLQTLMFSIGVPASLVASRLLGALCFFALFMAGERVILIILSIFCFSAAIVPWCNLLYF